MIQWRNLHSSKSKRLKMTDKKRLQLLIKNGKKIAVSYQRWHFDTLRCYKEEMVHKTWRQALWWLAGGQSRSQPRFVFKQSSSKAKDWDFGYTARLKRIALKVWRKIITLYLQSLYKSMPRRMKALVDAKHGQTKYWTYLWHVIVLFIE